MNFLHLHKKCQLYCLVCKTKHLKDNEKLKIQKYAFEYSNLSNL